MTKKEAVQTFLSSVWALVMPIIILGGIYSGIFTPTESGAIACVYGLICGKWIYKTLKWKDIPKILVNTAVGSGVIMLIFGSVQTFSFVLTRGHIPQLLADAMLGLTTNKYIILPMFNIILLIAGMFLNAVSAIALFTPDPAAGSHERWYQPVSDRYHHDRESWRRHDYAACRQLPVCRVRHEQTLDV